MYTSELNQEMCFCSYFISVELLVLASMTSYVVSYESIPGRMSPLVTTTLALINTLIKASDMVPDSKTLTAFEVWIISGLVQVQFRVLPAL